MTAVQKGELTEAPAIAVLANVALANVVEDREVLRGDVLVCEVTETVRARMQWLRCFLVEWTRTTTAS